MMLDRGWPDYNYPRLLENQMMDNYRVFLDSQSIRRNMQVERLIAGRNDQIVLKRHPELYKTFQVRNIAVNLNKGIISLNYHNKMDFRYLIKGKLSI